MTKLQIFLQKLRFFDQCSVFWPKFRFLNQNSDFLTKIPISVRIYLVDQNFDLFSIISIFYQNFHFWPKFRFLTKISIFDQNFDFWPKLWPIPKITIKVSVYEKLQKIFLSKNCWRNLWCPHPQFCGSKISKKKFRFLIKFFR